MYGTMQDVALRSGKLACPVWNMRELCSASWTSSAAWATAPVPPDAPLCCSLGPVAPEISGVKVYSEGESRNDEARYGDGRWDGEGSGG